MTQCPACGRTFDQVRHPRPGCPKCLPAGRPFITEAAILDAFADRLADSIASELERIFGRRK